MYVICNPPLSPHSPHMHTLIFINCTQHAKGFFFFIQLVSPFGRDQSNGGLVEDLLMPVVQVGCHRMLCY